MNRPLAALRAFLGRQLGRRGEDLAARHLTRQGMVVLARGYRTSQGEVDLICRDGDRLVFVEVKTRRAGQPAEAVDLAKQRRLTLAALHYQRRYGLLDTPARFDVVAIVWPDDRGRPAITHIQNAFEAVGRWQFHS